MKQSIQNICIYRTAFCLLLLIIISSLALAQDSEPAASPAGLRKAEYQRADSFGFTPEDDMPMIPYGIVANRKYIYVADPGRGRVFAYNHTGKQQFVIGERGLEEEQLFTPIRVEASDKFLAVYDDWGRRVFLYKASGEYLGTVHHDEMYSVEDIGVSRNRLYILRNDGTLKIYNKKLTMINAREAGQGEDVSGVFRDQVVNPIEMFVDSKGNGYLFYKLENEGYVRTYNKKGKLRKEMRLQGRSFLPIISMKVRKNGEMHFLYHFEVYIFDKNGHFRELRDLREYLPDLETFPQIWNIDYDSKGRLLLCDSHNRQVARIKSNGTADLQIGSDVSSRSALLDLQGFEVSEDGLLYVSQREFIKVFSTDGSFINEWKAYSQRHGWNIMTNNIADVYDGSIALVAWGGMYLYNGLSGDMLTEFGSWGSGKGSVAYPQDVEVAGNGDFYIGDPHSAKVVVYDSNGRFRKEISNSKVAWIKDIALDDKRNMIYIYDGEDVHALRTSGSYRKKINLGSKEWGRGSVVFDYNCVTTDSDGNLYVGGAGEVRIFNKRGKYQTSIFSEFEDEFCWLLATSVRVDANGKVYIADYFSGRVYVYERIK